MVLSLGGRRAVEIGVHLGEHAGMILNRTAIDILYLVDPWSDEFYSRKYKGNERYRICKKNLRKYGNRVNFIRDVSTSAVNLFPDHFFSFVYIDAQHQYEYIVEDLRIWWPKCKYGGIFAGHDYVEFNRKTGKKIGGVKDAVDEICAARSIIPNITEEYIPSWWFIK